jgi:hypothetical protein
VFGLSKVSIGMNIRIDYGTGLDATTIAGFLEARGLVAIAEEELARLEWERWERKALLDALEAHGITFEGVGQDVVSLRTWYIDEPVLLPTMPIAPAPYRLLRPIAYGALVAFRAGQLRTRN